MSEGNYVSYKKLNIDGLPIRLTFASVSSAGAHQWLCEQKKKKQKTKQKIKTKKKNRFYFPSFDRGCSAIVYDFLVNVDLLCAFVSDLRKVNIKINSRRNCLHF